MVSPEAFYASQVRIGDSAAILARRQWRKLGTDLDKWPEVAYRLTLLVSAHQIRAASDGIAYAADQIGNPVATLSAKAYGGWASDGLPLDSLLYGAVVESRTRFGSGMTDQEILLAGQLWLESVVRTQVADAGRVAAGAAITSTPRAEWVRYVNPPCCQDCAILAGKHFRWSQGFQRHPNCFPAGVVVSVPGIEAATRRWYEGELVILTTASGQELTLTGNHPVLTCRGWIPAHLLNEGDEVFRSTLPEGAQPLVVPDHHQVPALIEDVWRALSVSGLDRVPSAAEDFHGDGQQGEVDVVWADGSLGNGLVPVLAKHFDEPGFSGGSMLSSEFDTQRSAEFVNLGRAPHASCAVGSGSLLATLAGGHLRGSDGPGLAHIAALYASLGEDARNGASRDSVLLAERVLARASEVLADDLFGREVEGLPRWDAPAGPLTVETRDGYASRGLNLQQRLAGQIEVDRVVEVRRVEWSGHVYSLTSSEGWHTANSLIVSNCDCVHRPVLEDAPDTHTATISPDQIHDLTAAQRQALADGADLNQVVNAYRRVAPSLRTKMLTTAEGTTRRGYASYIRRAAAKMQNRALEETYRNVGRRGAVANYTERRVTARPTPEMIYAYVAKSGGGRAEAVQMLARHGYIVGEIQSVARLGL